ncbi:rhodanese-like domain-containing protein [Chloroflexota bacterium]
MHKINSSRKSLYFLAALLIFPALFIGCAKEQAVIREAADIYLSSNKVPNISAEELYEILYDDNPDNDPFILSVRSPEHYEYGHIPGAINIPWREVAKEENLAKLPNDRQIVVYCYTGHSSSQVASLLNILGYDTINLKFGMTSWTPNKDIAPGRYDESVDSHNYPLVMEGVEVPKCPTCPD